MIRRLRRVQAEVLEAEAGCYKDVYKCIFNLLFPFEASLLSGYMRKINNTIMHKEKKKCGHISRKEETEFREFFMLGILWILDEEKYDRCMMHTAHEYIQARSESSKEVSESFKEDKWLHPFLPF